MDAEEEAMMAAAEAAEAADAEEHGVAIWPVTVESKLIRRVDRAVRPAKGDGDARFRAAITASYEKKVWDGRYAICMHGVGPSGEDVYVEKYHPRRLRLQPPAFAANRLAVEAALRACEMSKKMRAGTLTQRYRIEELSYAVGYEPAGPDDGAPKRQFIVSVWMETKGHFDAVRRYFSETMLRGEECAYQVTVHEDNLDHIQQFVHETTGDKCGCAWLRCTGITPFKRTDVVDADVKVMATTVEVHPSPAPPDPDLDFAFFDIECVKSQTAEECRKVMANPALRDALPDPNKGGHEVRMIAVDYVKGDVTETVVYEWQPDPAKRRPAPWTVRTRGMEYSVVNRFGTEATMLMEFLDDVRRRKCRVLAGHNINQFDIPYIIARLALLLPSVPIRALVFGFDPSNRYEKFYDFERRSEVGVVDGCKQRLTIMPRGTGVVVMDTIIEARSLRHGQLKRLGLAAVCETILQRALKDPVHFTDIETGLNGIMTEERYRELCALTETELPDVFDPAVHPWQLIRTYCVKDSHAVRDLVMLRMGPKVVGIAMNSAVPLQDVSYGKSKLLVTTRHGQQCARDGVVLNRREPLLKPPANKDGKKFLGGLVHEVVSGLWSCVADDAPAFGPQEELPEALKWIYKYVPKELLRQCLIRVGILQLDFESMYPNIIMEGNLSPDTQLENFVRYAHELYEARVRELREEPEPGPPFPPPPVVPHDFPTGLWADAPNADWCSTYVVKSAVEGTAPFVFRFVKEKVHHGALTKVVQHAFEERKRRKKDKGLFKKVAAKIDAAGKPKAIKDPMAVYDATKRLIAEGRDVTAETLAELTGLTPEELKYAAKLLSKQADVDQAVLKIINNAMFGACGFSPKNPHPLRQPEPTESIAVAASITARGQQQNRITEAHMRDVWDLEKVAGDTDSVLSAMKLEQFAEGCATFDEVIAKAWAHSERIAESVNGLIDSPHAKIEPDGLTIGGYFHAMKNRATLDVVDPKLPMEKVVKGMKPARVNEPGVVRAAAQAFIDVVFATTRSPITGFRMALVCNLWDFFERFLLAPGATNECGHTGHAFDMYVRRTYIRSIKSKLKSTPPHLVVIKAKSEREKLPPSFYVGSFIEWVVVREGPKAKSLRAVEASQTDYEHLDLANAIDDVFRYLTTIVTKPWQTGDKSQILPAAVWASMKATYTTELSASNSKLVALFGGRRGHTTTPEERLAAFLDILARPDGAAAAAATAAAAPKRKRKAAAAKPPSVTLNSFFRPTKKAK